MNCPTCGELFHLIGKDGDLILCARCAELVEVRDGNIILLTVETKTKLIETGDYEKILDYQAKFIDHIVKERTMH